MSTRPKPHQCRVADPVERVRFRDVGGVGKRAGPLGSCVFSEGGDAGGVDVDGDDTGAAAGQGGSDRAADAAGSSGDDCDLVVQSVHLPILVVHQWFEVPASTAI
jgi:hypothetical protein